MPAIQLYGHFLAYLHRVCSPSGRGAPVQTSIRGRTCVVQAFAESYAHSCGGAGCATHERILRYPDGRERRIRYPVVVDDPSTLDSGHEDWETRNAWKAVSRGSAAPEKTAPAVNPDVSGSDGAFPMSPLALLRLLNSDVHRQTLQREWEDVCNSYEILLGCPWAKPRPLYVLADVKSGNGESGMTYTLRTRLPLSNVEFELNRLLRPGTDSEPIIECSELVDGVVAFEDDADAEQYGDLLAAAGSGHFSIAECNSHEMFRTACELKSAVILLRRGCKVPAPHKLAASVRKVRAPDDGP